MKIEIDTNKIAKIFEEAGLCSLSFKYVDNETDFNELISNLTATVVQSIERVEETQININKAHDTINTLSKENHNLMIENHNLMIENEENEQKNNLIEFKKIKRYVADCSFEVIDRIDELAKFESTNLERVKKAAELIPYATAGIHYMLRDSESYKQFPYSTPMMFTEEPFYKKNVVASEDIFPQIDVVQENTPEMLGRIGKKHEDTRQHELAYLKKEIKWQSGIKVDKDNLYYDDNEEYSHHDRVRGFKWSTRKEYFRESPKETKYRLKNEYLVKKWNDINLHIYNAAKYEEDRSEVILSPN